MYKYKLIGYNKSTVKENNKQTTRRKTKMKTTYINNGEYRIDEFEDGKRFLLKKNGNYYEVVGEINRNTSKED